MNNKSVSLIKETAFTLTSVIPFALSMAVCAGMGTFAGAVVACIAALVFPIVEQKKQMPIYLSFLIIAYAFKSFGAATVSLAIIICGFILVLCCFEKKTSFPKLHPSISSAVILSVALTVTVLFTTDYFGIGASGNTVREIIASYLSLGFHPNWRGVLYGTIVLVIMITFPRKFKKNSKIINAAFYALLISTVLNFFLNPPEMISAINEAGKLSLNEYKDNILFPLISSFSNISYKNAFYCGVALFFSSYYALSENENHSRKDFILCGASNCLLGFGSCIVLPYGIKKEKFTAGVLSAVITAILIFSLQDFISRIPVHTCAVILIVGAWQSIKWSELKNTFSSAKHIILFAVSVIICMFFGITYGYLISVALSVIFTNRKIVSKDF